MADQIIIHVDMDAFYASVEVRDDPSLRGKPLVIGSLPQERGVVATCSYEARKYGIHSAMNIKEAFSLCPHAVFMHPNFEKYSAVSRQLHEIWNTYATASEYVALDEAYLDVTQTAVTLEGARSIAHTIKQRTRDELGLTCSVGIGYSKTSAKTASEEKKPDGYFEIPTPEDFVRLVQDRDVRVLYTVGAKTAEKLATIGIRAVRELTFQEDVNDWTYIRDVLLLLSLSVAHRARRVGLFGGGVTLKITYADMKSISRSRLTDACDTPAQIFEEAARLLTQVDHRPIRLVGVSLYDLSSEKWRQLTFSDLTEAKAPDPLSMYLEDLGMRYHLDFAGHLEQLSHGETLYRTVEYMRKHK